MFAVVQVPDFVVHAVLRHEPGMASGPFVLVDPGQGSPRVVALNEVARAHGVEEGQTAPQAMARCPGVVVRHRSAAAEGVARDALVQSAHAFSPHVEWTGEGCMTLDMRGLADPGPGASVEAMAGWGRRMVEVKRGLGLDGVVGIGPTPGIARHAALALEAARAAGKGGGGEVVRVVTACEAAAFVAGLPVSMLGPSAHAARLMRQWGVGLVGEMLRLGQGELADRLGLEAFALWAAASHSATRPLRHERLPETFAEEATIDPPVETLQPLLFLLRRFADSLSLRLAGAGHAAGELVMRLRLESGDMVEQRLRIPQPTHRAEVLFRMLGTAMEGLRTAAPVSGVRLLAEPARAHQHQFGLFESALRDPHQFHETLARLSALVGAERVGSPVRHGGHRPDQFRLVPPDFEGASDAVGRRVPEMQRPVPVRRLRPSVMAEVTSAGGEECRAGRGAGGTGFAGAIPDAKGGGGAVMSATGIAALLDPLFRPARKDEAGSGTGSGTDPDVLPFPGVDGGGALALGELGAAGGLAKAGPWAEPGRPEWVRCAVGGGRVRMAMGPVRSSGGWWDAGHGWERVEWDVMLPGRHGLRLAWDGTGWSVDAVLD